MPDWPPATRGLEKARELVDLTLQEARAAIGGLRPPVLEGQEVGKLNIFCADVLVQETPLYANATVEEGDLVRKSTDALKQLLLGWLP